MKNTLLEKCNADVFKAILDIKAEKPDAGQAIINLLQKHEYWWQMSGNEILSLAMPMRDIWDLMEVIFRKNRNGMLGMAQIQCHLPFTKANEFPTHQL